MSYFSGNVDPEDYAEGLREGNPRRSRLKLNIAIFGVVLAALSTTFAANISLTSGQRKEFGQGIYQIRACDQWVGIGLQTAAAPDNAYVGTVKLYGFDPRLCVGRIFRIKLFQSGSTTPLDLYLGKGATSGTDTSSVLSLMDTSTSLASSGYIATSNPTRSAYDNWAYDSVTIVDKFGRNVGYDDGYVAVDYTYSTGVYSFLFTYPRAVASLVTSVTIESAKYN
jgi:hypothetical protein